MYLTIAELEPYMAVISDYNQALIQNKINIYSESLNEATYNNFQDNPNQECVFHNQRTVMYSIPAFQDDSTFKVFFNDEELLPSQYLKIKPKFEVQVQGVKQPKPITRIKLVCPTFPEHFTLTIKGNQCWSKGLPDDLYFILLDLLHTEIKYNALINPKNEFRLNSLNIQSEKVGTRYISYTSNTRNKDVLDVLNFGLNASKYKSVISKYRNESKNFMNKLYQDKCNTLDKHYNTFNFK